MKLILIFLADVLKEMKYNKDGKQLFVAATGVVSGYGKTSDGNLLSKQSYKLGKFTK